MVLGPETCACWRASRLPPAPTCAGFNGSNQTALRCSATVRRRQPRICCLSTWGQESPSERIPETVPVVDSQTDWREFRAKLVTQQQQQELQNSQNDSACSSKQAFQEGYWAHTIHKPEKGSLLIAHPLMFATNQTYFNKAVIFLFEDSADGTAGLILNRPTQYAIGSVAGAEVLCPEFRDNQLHLGGDVGKDTVMVLHSRAELEGAIQVVPGVATGGINAAKAAVGGGLVPASQFKWFTRYAGWGPGQLQKECEAGVWFTAAAGKDVILDQEAGADLWYKVLEMMGGEHAELAEAVRESYRADVMEVSPGGDMGAETLDGAD